MLDKKFCLICYPIKKRYYNYIIIISISEVLKIHVTANSCISPSFMDSSTF